MTGIEALADPANVEFEFVDLAGLEECFVIEAFAITGRARGSRISR